MYAKKPNLTMRTTSIRKPLPESRPIPRPHRSSLFESLKRVGGPRFLPHFSFNVCFRGTSPAADRAFVHRTLQLSGTLMTIRTVLGFVNRRSEADIMLVFPPYAPQFIDKGSSGQVLWPGKMTTNPFKAAQNSGCFGADAFGRHIAQILLATHT